MTTLREAAQQALEALEMYAIETDSEFQRKAIIALRAALAQQAELKGGGRLPPPLQTEPVPQPGVWMHPWPPVRAQQAEPVQRSQDWHDGVLEGQLREREREHWLAQQAEPVQGPDLSRCPQCGGIADNGHDRSIPPNPYLCTKCMAEPEPCPNCASLEAQNNELDRKLAEVEQEEREACAKLAESTICDTHLPTGVRIYGTRVAAAIRARSKE